MDVRHHHVKTFLKNHQVAKVAEILAERIRQDPEAMEIYKDDPFIKNGPPRPSQPSDYASIHRHVARTLNKQVAKQMHAKFSK